MSDQILQALYFNNLQAYDANSKPQDKLLQSFNIFTVDRPNELLMNLIPCIENGKTIPSTYISSSTGAQSFKSQYLEQSSSRETKREFSASVGIEGSYGVFSASMQMDYSKSEATSTTAFYSCYRAKLSIGTLSFKADKADTRNLLNPALIKQLDGINSMAKAHDFIETWGTHLVTRVNLGGTLFVSIQADTNSKEEKEKLSLDIKTKYDGAIASLSAAASVVTEMRKSSATKNVKHDVVALGGLATKAAMIDPDNKASYQAWIDTCTENTVFAASESIELYKLAEGDAQGILKKYIDLKMLAYSLEHPTVFAEEKSISPYNNNTITAPTTYTKGYKIIGGGAAASLGCSSYLIGSYPQAEGSATPTGWHAASHDIAIAANPSNILSAYAIAVYDPENYLEVTVATAKGKNKGLGIDEAEVTLGDGWVLTAGGINCSNVDSANKFVLASYFKSPRTWAAACSDYISRSTNTETTVYAVGIKSRDPHLSITSTQIKGAESYGQHGRGVANAQTCVCGGGVRVWNNTGMGNLVQKTFPVSPTSWAEVNNDMIGNISRANYQAYAIAIIANVV
jgi:hypothetical protein